MKRRHKGHQVTYQQKPGCLPRGDNSVSELDLSRFEASGACLEGRNSTTELLPQKHLHFSPKIPFGQRWLLDTAQQYGLYA